MFVWLFPMTQGVDTALFRIQALLVPCVVLSKRFPIAVQVVLVAVGAVIAYQTAVLFFSFDLS